MIDVSHLSKGEVLSRLYNASKPQGVGILRFYPSAMTAEEAENLCVNEKNYFNYLNGRIMKVSINGSTLDPRLYDRDNGNGAAAKALA